MRWQYNGVASFDEIYQWCRQNIPNHVTFNGWETFVFSDECAYIWFLLRWS